MPRPARHLTDSETASAVSKPWAPLSTRGALANRRNDQNSALAAAFFRRGQRLAQLATRSWSRSPASGVWPRPSNSALDFGWPELALHWQACCYLKQNFRLFILESLVSRMEMRRELSATRDRRGAPRSAPIVMRQRRRFRRRSSRDAGSATTRREPSPRRRPPTSAASIQAWRRLVGQTACDVQTRREAQSIF